MIHRPDGIGGFQFVVLATLRAAQLIRGCTPKVDGIHKATVTAQMEVSEGKVMQVFTGPDALIGAVAIVAPIDDVPALVLRT